MSLTPEQHANRQLGFGGSDAASACGMSKWKTPLQLYLEKRGELAISREETQLQYWGKKLEPIVRQEYADRTGFIVRQPEGTIWHPKFDWMCAHVDGVVVEHRRGYEGKCSIQFLVEEWGPYGSDEVPDDYLFQCQHYMIVYGLPVWDLAVLIGGHDYRQYEIPADKELQEMIIECERDMARRIREGDPPTVDYTHRSALDLLRKLYPGTNGQRIEATPEIIEIRQALEEASSQKKASEHVIDEMKARLLDFMGENALLAFPDGKCFRRKQQHRASYTVEAVDYVDARFINDPDLPKSKRGARK